MISDQFRKFINEHKEIKNGLFTASVSLIFIVIMFAINWNNDHILFVLTIISIIWAIGFSISFYGAVSLWKLYKEK